MKKLVITMTLMLGLTALNGFNLGEVHAQEPWKTKAEITLTAAAEKLGSPYVWGANSESEFDCSSLMQYIHKEIGINLPRTSKEQVRVGKAVVDGKIRAGDLIFFDTRDEREGDAVVTHVGIYAGKKQFIHASSKSGKVVVSSLDDDYYLKRVIAIRRYY